MKKQYTFTIDENIYKEFNELSKIKSLNKSLFVENNIIEYIKKEKNKKLENDTNKRNRN